MTEEMNIEVTADFQECRFWGDIEGDRIIKGRLEDWMCVTVWCGGLRSVFLVGMDPNKPGRATMTSGLVTLDLERRLARTRSGSVYDLGERAEGGLPPQLAVSILKAYLRSLAR